ncbi:MAG: pseudouridine synthase [Ignavibacteria bacterium RBG_16_34_14]|nr:MAG: pseudouridine synthase [Ignavibacteria bacterium RBG_16_34_14]
MRLNRYIANSGITSRRKSEEFILQGRVSVNNKVVTDLAYKVDDEKDRVMVDEEKIHPKKHLYFLLNKPKGVVTTTDDEKQRKTVVDLIKTKERIYPVGRLDYNTTGVLLLTNDGEFSNLLTHPGNKIPREYEVKIDNPLAEEDRIKLLKGVSLDGRNAVFIKVFINDSSRKNVKVVAVEGRNHFVKKMFGALGYTVLKLNRKKFAGVKADIPLGAYRKLTRIEVEGIYKQYAK